MTQGEPWIRLVCRHYLSANRPIAPSEFPESSKWPLPEGSVTGVDALSDLSVISPATFP